MALELKKNNSAWSLRIHSLIRETYITSWFSGILFGRMTINTCRRNFSVKKIIILQISKLIQVRSSIDAKTISENLMRTRIFTASKFHPVDYLLIGKGEMINLHYRNLEGNT